MLSVGKRYVMFFCVFIVFGMLLLLLVEPCIAPVTVPAKPKSGPEIVSIEVHSDHFWSPPQYSTHPYTGETTVISPGYYIPRGTMDIKIKNSPFTPYTDKNGNTINLYYSFYMYRTDLTLSHHELDSIWNYQLSTYGPFRSVYQSDSDYTIITFSYGVNTYGSPDIWYNREGDNIYFRVQSVTGYFDVDGSFFGGVYEGVGSEWVEYMVTMPVTSGTSPRPTSTVVVPVIPKPSNTDSNNNNPLPPQQFNIVILVVAVCIIAFLLVVIVYQYVQRKNGSVVPPSSSSILFLMVRCKDSG